MSHSSFSVSQNNELVEVVLLRGLGRESGHWLDFPEVFASRLKNISVRTLDLPGFGDFESEHTPMTISATTDFLREFLFHESRNGQKPSSNESSSAGTKPLPAATESRAQGSQKSTDDRKVKRVLVAFSLGGMVATDWLFRFPEELVGVVLMNTSLRRFSSMTERLRPGSWWRILKILSSKTMAQREAEVLQMVSNHSRDRDLALPRWIEIQTKRPMQIKNLLRQLSGAARYQAPRGKPQAPVLILNSRLDRMVNSQCSTEIAERWQVPILYHPSAGHDLCVDDSEWVANSIQKWLQP
jgi:pimeloyl-ACP methyl ester carboxylesterase